MKKFLSLTAAVLLIAAGLFAALAASNLPMLGNWVWAVTALFLALGVLAVQRTTSLSYLTLVVPLAFVLADAGSRTIWPSGSTADLGTPRQDAAASVPLSPVRIGEGPAEIRGRTLSLPADWQVNVFASGLGKARMLELGADGTLLVSVPDRGKILALPDADRDGVADEIIVYAEGLSSVHGLARTGDVLWAAETSRLLRLPDRNRDLRADEIIVHSRDFPTGGGHWTRSLAARDEEAIFLAAGSSCNACREEDARRAAVMTFSRDREQGELFASGLRNSVGLALHPQTGQLWGSDNGRDMLGDNLPPDEINQIRAGGDYGWPYCYGDRVPDPELGSSQRCQDTIPASIELQAHSAPLGITFISGESINHPADHLLLIAYHGSWNRTVPTGYKLVAVPFTAGRPSGRPFDLVRGWLVDGQAWGRPVAPRLGADGALYLTDDLRGIVYRFTLPN